jgi:hypothetical protein
MYAFISRRLNLRTAVDEAACVAIDRRVEIYTVYYTSDENTNLSDIGS